MPDLRLGIVGLPNVGKSTLFNALTGALASAENYPFCTVDPNVGVVSVPDPRLDLLHERTGSRTKVPTMVTFVDIAGLVKGASEGEGLGNQFLQHIREVHAIVHVVRCFEDDDVSHVMGEVDPVRDREIINLELALADLQAVERRLPKAEKNARLGEREYEMEYELLQQLHAALSEGKPARVVRPDDPDRRRIYRTFNLLTSKRELYLANVAEHELPGDDNPHVVRLRQIVEREHEPAEVVPLSARIEAELLQLPAEDRAAFLAELGLEEPGLNRLIHAGYHLLDLISFFTTGEKESRAWTIARGTKAPRAAAEIHTDFERGFIRAETVGWSDFVAAGSMKSAREKGFVRSEGKEYVVQDGDIILFRFNV